MTLFLFFQYNDTQLSCVFEKKKGGPRKADGSDEALMISYR
jgi:hypothetical protein